MTPLLIGALLAIAALVWVIAPIFEDTRPVSRSRGATPEEDAAAEAEIRKWRDTNS